jgi:hypothetical protein
MPAHLVGRAAYDDHWHAGFAIGDFKAMAGAPGTDLGFRSPIVGGNAESVGNGDFLVGVSALGGAAENALKQPDRQKQ